LISSGLLATFGTVFVIDVYDRASAHAIRPKRKTEIDREKEREAKEKRSREVETFEGITKREGDRDKREAGEELSALFRNRPSPSRNFLRPIFYSRRCRYSTKLVARLFTTG